MLAPTQMLPKPPKLTDLLEKCTQNPMHYAPLSFQKVALHLHALHLSKQTEACEPYWIFLKTLLQKYPEQIDLNFSDCLLTRIALQQQNTAVLEWLIVARHFNLAEAFRHAMAHRYEGSIAYLLGHQATNLQKVLSDLMQKITTIQHNQTLTIPTKQNVCQTYWNCIKELLERLPEKINLTFEERQFLKASRQPKRNFTFAQHQRLNTIKARLQVFESLLCLAVAQHNVQVLEWFLESPHADVHYALQYALSNNYDTCLPYLLGHPKLDLQDTIAILDTNPSEIAEKIFRNNLAAYGYEWTDHCTLEAPSAFTSLEAELLNLEIATKEATFTEPSIALAIELYIEQKLTAEFKKIHAQMPEFAQLIYDALPLLAYPEPQHFYKFKQEVWRRSKPPARLTQERNALATLKIFFLQAFGLDDDRLSGEEKLEKFTAPVLKHMMTQEELTTATNYFEVARCRFVTPELLKNCKAILDRTLSPDAEEWVPLSPTVIQFSIPDTNKNAPSPQRDEASSPKNQIEHITPQ